MTFFHEKYFHRSYWTVCLGIFFVVALRNVFVPFSHDEVATFFFYIQPGEFIPFYAHPDANGHFLINITSWICFKLFGSQVWSLRIPCMGAYWILTYAIFKMNKLIKGLLPKIFFTGAFLLSYNFLGYFALCRGYGFSMALLILALYYFFVYIRYQSFKHFWKFLLFSQLALSANLTLVPVLLLLTTLLIFFQIKNNLFKSGRNFFVLLLHFAFIFYWIKYGFYLKEMGALYYGEGDSYWTVTFESLVQTLTVKSQIVNVAAVLIFVLMIVFLVYNVFKQGKKYLIESSFSVAFLSLCALIVGFFLLKIFFGVNYPEDRTGLFFYVFFIVSLAYLMTELTLPKQSFFLILPLLFLIHFLLNFDTRVHPWRVYETMPKRFFKLLVEEQKKSERPITIAGHRVREFFYGFINYNSKTKLNHITAPEALQMNCDYALAYEQDKPYYDKYYTELATEKDWGFRLLKRRSPIERRLIFQKSDYVKFEGDFEFYNAMEMMDTSFNAINPLMAEFNFDVNQCEIPFNAWFVLQIDAADESPSTFIRVPLNLLKYDWNGTKNFSTSLVSGNIPIKMKRMVAYLWSIDKKPISIQFNSFKLYQLFGEGVTEVSPAKI